MTKPVNTPLAALCRETCTYAVEWEETDGPDSGVGVDHWFRHRGTGEEAYVNEDQGHMTVSFPEEC